MNPTDLVAVNAGYRQARGFDKRTYHGLSLPKAPQHVRAALQDAQVFRGDLVPYWAVEAAVYMMLTRPAPPGTRRRRRKHRDAVVMLRGGQVLWEAYLTTQRLLGRV